MLCAALLLATPAAGTADSRDPLAAARALYVQASYEEALAAMEGVDGVDAHQYRALCLLALGRLPEVEQALEAIVHDSPGYVLPDGEVPPRLLQLFVETRQRVLPKAIRDIFAGGRTQFLAASFAGARAAFHQVLVLVHDPAVAGAPLMSDLRLLASGYLDLIAHAEASPLTVRGPLTARLRPALAPALEAPPPPGRGSAVVVVPAMAVHQEIPTWVTAAGDGVPRLSAAVRVVIDPDGSVRAASIERSADPTYDARLLSAARGWHYEPATRDGVPVAFETVVEVHLGRD